MSPAVPVPPAGLPDDHRLVWALRALADLRGEIDDAREVIADSIVVLTQLAEAAERREARQREARRPASGGAADAA